VSYEKSASGERPSEVVSRKTKDPKKRRTPVSEEFGDRSRSLGERLKESHKRTAHRSIREKKETSRGIYGRKIKMWRASRKV